MPRQNWPDRRQAFVVWLLRADENRNREGEPNGSVRSFLAMGTHTKAIQSDVIGEHLANLVAIAGIGEGGGQYLFQFHFQLVEFGLRVR